MSSSRFSDLSSFVATVDLSVVSVRLRGWVTVSDGGRFVLWMVIERFKGGDPAPVYRRFRERGRLAPAGLTYVGSWVRADLALCWQVMEGTREDLDAWTAAWSDLVDFEVVPVLTSAEAS